ncbi:PREDICTED: interleukin-34 [Calidris pugnax]|uniref:interleukin-34 n=1 Tax=Calidris pugnax TaxID=198806 RepID=UPI00071D85B7|nr:PREDICTED: interleukin-34 [Calidris pugnax]
MSPSLCCQPLCSSLLPPQKHNFPIDYTVQVQYEEVLRPSNITRLRNGTVSEVALRYLWFHLSSQAVLRIREVLPEKHPSWRYTQELGHLFDALGKEYSKYRQVGRPPKPLLTPPLAVSHTVLGLEAAAPGECELTRLLQDKLQYEMRLQYMVTPTSGGVLG